MFGRQSDEVNVASVDTAVIGVWSSGRVRQQLAFLKATNTGTAASNSLKMAFGLRRPDSKLLTNCIT